MKGNDSEEVMALYRTLVRDLLAAGKPGTVSNSSIEHAPLILEELVRSARKTFFAFCGGANDPAWTPGVHRAVAAAHRRGVEVQVLDPSMLTLDPQALASVRYFAVADCKSLRLENGKPAGTALFAINQPKIAAELEAIFDTLSSRAKEV